MAGWQDREGQSVWGSKVDTVEAVFQVNLEEAHWAKSWIGMVHSAEETMSGPPKLHGLLESKGEGVIIQEPEGVVHQESWLSVSFHFDLRRGQACFREVLHFFIGEDDPLITVSKIHHFFCHEVGVQAGRAVATPGSDFVPVFQGPGCVIKLDRTPCS